MNGPDIKVVIHQPDFLPYIGFFDRLKLADKYVVLDHVKLSKSGWTHRDKILTESGVEWLSVPIVGLKKEPLIKDALISHGKEYDKIVRRLYSAYRLCPYFKIVFPKLECIFNKKPTKLIELNTSLINLVLELLEIKIPIFYSSKLDIKLTRSEMNAEITKCCGGNVYLSGMGAQNYHLEQPFISGGIVVKWRDFNPFKYKQTVEGFVPQLSIVDLLMNLSTNEIMDKIGK